MLFCEISDVSLSFWYIWVLSRDKIEIKIQSSSVLFDGNGNFWLIILNSLKKLVCLFIGKSIVSLNIQHFTFNIIKIYLDNNGCIWLKIFRQKLFVLYIVKSKILRHSRKADLY